MEHLGLTHTTGYPVGKRLSGKYEGTFGSLTLKERLPRVLTQIIDTLHRYHQTAQQKHGEDGTKAVQSVLAKLSELRYCMQTDKPMTSILTGEDVKEWNFVFDVYRKKLGKEPHWYAVSWLFFECYMYRKVMELIKMEACLIDYDPFQVQKERSLTESLEQMKIIGLQLLEFVQKPSLIKPAFEQFLLLCLWGNKIDLSMAVTMDTYDMNYQLQCDQLKPYVLSDHSQLVWDLLNTPRKPDEKREIAFVIDNAGFELFSDFCLAEWLLASGLADNVTFYCKQMPWFISDATRKDINWTLEQLSTSDNPGLKSLGQLWLDRITNGTMVISDHPFWTTCYEYTAMKIIAPDLYSALSKSLLIIFKGDLNYRKLISDRNWSYMENFKSALQNFQPSNVVALRTLKADLVAGLPEGAAARAAQESKDWMIKGQFAVLQVALV